MSLLHSGGWISTTSLNSDLYGAQCGFCGRTIVDRAWLLVAESSLVCLHCMPNPDAERGVVGRRMLYRLRNVIDREQRQTPEDDLVIL